MLCIKGKDMLTVKEMIEKLKEFPEDMEILNYEYLSIGNDMYIDAYYDDNGKEKEYVIIC